MEISNINILIVDDNEEMRESLNSILSDESYKVIGVDTIALAKKELKKQFINVILIDLKLPDGSGLEVLKEAKKENNETLAIIFTAWASLESALGALNAGAFAYVQKPLNVDELKITIKKALDMQKLSIENKNLLEKLKEISLIDPHTELYNYRYLMERLEKEVKRARRFALPLSVIMLDIDYFKSINDVYGHQYGDAILKEFAQCLKDFSRPIDVVTRYGGEEFIIILPETNARGAVKFGERLLNSINNHVFDSKDKQLKLKISLGTSSFPEDDYDGGTEAGLINSADTALLNAKDQGGNRVSSFNHMDKPREDLGEKGVKESVEELKKSWLIWQTE